MPIMNEFAKNWNSFEIDEYLMFDDYPDKNEVHELDEWLPSEMQIRSAKRRKQFVSKNLSNAKRKSTKKQCCYGTYYIGESSASQQPSEEKKKDLKEIIEENSVLELVKIIKDIINLQILKDMADMKAFLMSTQNQIQWPLRSDLQDIMEKINGIESDYKKAADLNTGIATMELTDDAFKRRSDEFKRRLVEAREALENLNEQLRKDSIKTRNLEAVFTNSEGFSEKALKREFFSEFPSIVLEETATNGSTTTAKDQGSLGTREQLLAIFSNLANELYAMDNNKVDVSDFHGLKEALEETTWGKTPDYLEPVAVRIEKARGKATEVSHNNIQVLVCAAIHEMEDLQVEKLNWDTMKKWGATLNMAKELGFQVEFAENLLSKNLYAYFAYATNVK